MSQNWSARFKATPLLDQLLGQPCEPRVGPGSDSNTPGWKLPWRDKVTGPHSVSGFR